MWVNGFLRAILVMGFVCRMDKMCASRVGTVFDIVYDFGVWGFSLPFSIRVGWCHSSEG